jgi:hypothetical protein
VNFGIAFSRKDIEAEIGSTLSDKQLEALIFELEDAFEYYFEADLLEQWKEEIQSGTDPEQEIGSLDQYIVEISEETVGKFTFDRDKVQAALELEISDRDFVLIVDYFERAFAKYFSEECERLWADIETIVKEFEE